MSMLSRYQKRISGPLLDRIDIHIDVPRVEYEKLSDERSGEPSAAIRERVEAVRERQRQRFEGSEWLSNAAMGPAKVCEFCPVDDAGKSLLRAAMQQLHMSAQAYHRILKLARTIADLTGSESIGTTFGLSPLTGRAMERAEPPKRQRLGFFGCTTIAFRAQCG